MFENSVKLLTQAIQKEVSSLSVQIFISDQFSSKNESCRLMIRKHIVDTFKYLLTPSECESVLDLKNIPTSAQCYFSISHNLNNGGYAQSTSQIGFDLEDFNRVKPEVVQRVSTPHDIRQAPSTQYLWSAKESIFKLISQTIEKTNSDFVLSHINSISWNSSNLVDLFYTQYKQKAVIGALIKEENTIISIACFAE